MPNTVVAPTSSTTTPISAEATPVDGFPTLASIASIACAGSSPISPRSWPNTSPRAASAPNTSPAIEITITSSGAIENTL